MTALERSVLAVAALMGAVGWYGMVSTPEPSVGPLIAVAVERGYFPCVTEDAPGPCYWDASERGNGTGTDFVVTDDNEVFYQQ